MLEGQPVPVWEGVDLVGRRRDHSKVDSRCLPPRETADVVDSRGVDEPRDLGGRRTGSHDPDSCLAKAARRSCWGEIERRGDGVRGVTHPGRCVGPLDEQSVRGEDLQNRNDGRSRDRAEPLRKLLDRPAAVEEWKQNRQQHPGRSPLEDDDGPAVLEQEPFAVPEQAVPRREERPPWKRFAQSSP